MGLEGRREGEVEGLWTGSEVVDVLILGGGRLGLSLCIQAMNMIAPFESD